MSRPPRAQAAEAETGPARVRATKRGLRVASDGTATARGPKPSLAAIVASATPPSRNAAAKGAVARKRSASGSAEIVRLDPGAAPPQAGATLKERARQMSVYLEPPVYEQLREMAHAERTKMHALMLEALDLLFKQRGARSIAQVTQTR